MRFKCASFDPGMHNFAFSMIEFDEINLKFRIVEAGIMASTVTQMTELPTQIDAFSQESMTLIAGYEPRMLAAERFLNRGRMQQALNEKINVQIGVLIAEGARLGAIIGVPTSGLWKPAMGKLFDLNAAYNEGRRLVREALKAHMNKVTVGKRGGVKRKRKLNTLDQKKSKELQDMVAHTLDATLIGLYHILKTLKVPPRKWAQIIVIEKVLDKLVRVLIRKVGIRDA